MTADEIRDAEIRAFVRDTFGLRGTLRIHRDALGLDLLRAPVNVALAPVFLLSRLLALALHLVRLRRASAWILGRQVFLRTSVARTVADRLEALLARLDARDAGVAADPARRTRAIDDYVGVRSAVSEITTSLIVLALGYLVFHAATPGIVSLAPNVADRLAQAEAARGFWAGERLGTMWYGAFPADIPPRRIVLTGFILAMLASVVTTFAGLFADPVQRATGMHRRRLRRLLSRLDRGTPEGLAPEHFAARTGDLVDAALALLRAFRG
ncbi:hypothetical protein ROJ8625_00038 [Roseivivax jejudonensis]|uniref:Uncharacterized protein n=1 Tax=Roseivivax jejudonensis TaxID=1529041 RepID=A0A1X6Y360_9RHOB|nr:DUF6635 family protein [Roseivivax jejudonensis]SLN09627.1 hypothetical protein ROJ8625_00038 [Roseivivax jejudonensis]